MVIARRFPSRINWDRRPVPLWIRLDTLIQGVLWCTSAPSLVERRHLLSEKASRALGNHFLQAGKIVKTIE